MRAAKPKDKIEAQNKQPQATVNDLVSESIDLKRRIQETELKLADLEGLIE
jgi:hypothetical protein